MNFSNDSLAWVSLTVSLVGSVGSVYLSVGMGLKACPLCFYQRAFLMAAFSVLGVGFFVDRSNRAYTCALALPAAVAGLGVAAFHSYLVLRRTLECPKGLFGLGTIPIQSLVLFFGLAIFLAASATTNGSGLSAIALGSVIGVVIAWGSVASAPPLPPNPTSAYSTPFDTCRPPYRAR